MPESLYGFKIGNTTYQYDYEYLLNKPTASLPAIPTGGNGDNAPVSGLTLMTINDET
jgi:hypothetical protein